MVSRIMGFAASGIATHSSSPNGIPCANVQLGTGFHTPIGIHWVATTSAWLHWCGSNPHRSGSPGLRTEFPCFADETRPAQVPSIRGYALTHSRRMCGTSCIDAVPCLAPIHGGQHRLLWPWRHRRFWGLFLLRGSRPPHLVRFPLAGAMASGSFCHSASDSYLHLCL